MVHLRHVGYRQKAKKDSPLDSIALPEESEGAGDVMDVRGPKEAGTSAVFARLIPQPSVATPEEPAEPSVAAQAAHILRNALIPERRFYRVLRESKLFAIDFGASALHVGAHTDSHARNGAEILQSPVSLAESDYKVVRIEEMTKPTGGRVGSSSTLSSSISSSSLSSARSRGQNGHGQPLDRRGETRVVIKLWGMS